MKNTMKVATIVFISLLSIGMASAEIIYGHGDTSVSDRWVSFDTETGNLTAIQSSPLENNIDFAKYFSEDDIFFIGGLEFLTSSLRYSDDNGSNWQNPLDQISTSVNNIAYRPSDGLYMAVGDDSTGAVYTSTDYGGNYTDISNSGTNPWTNGGITDVEYSESLDLFVLVGDDGITATHDGTSFIANSTVESSTQNVQNVEWSPEHEVFVAASRAPAKPDAWISSDGLNWIIANTSGEGSGIDRLYHSNGMFVGTERNFGQYFYSTDGGTTWDTGYTDGGSSATRSATYSSITEKWYLGKTGNTLETSGFTSFTDITSGVTGFVETPVTKSHFSTPVAEETPAANPNIGSTQEDDNGGNTRYIQNENGETIGYITGGTIVYFENTAEEPKTTPSLNIGGQTSTFDLKSWLEKIWTQLKEAIE